jgi:phenylacetate-CoA ligase
MNQAYEELAEQYWARRDLFPGRFQSRDELRHLPWVIDKADLRRLYPFGLCQVEQSDIYSYHESFGTTGTPTAGFYSRADFERAVAQIASSPVQFRRGDRALIRFPYAISVPAHLFHHAVQGLGGGVIACSSRTPVSPYPRVVSMLAQLGATLLCAMPTEAIILAFYAQRMGLAPRQHFPKLRALCCAGEQLPESMRRYLSKLWGVEVYNFYGSTETGNIACACAEGRLHPAWEDFQLETLTLPNGLTELIVSTLGKQALPLFKYRIEDLVEFDQSDCPCGRSGATLRVLGRASERYVIRGTHVGYGAIKEAVFDYLQAAEPNSGVSPFFRTFAAQDHLHVQMEGLRDPASLQRVLASLLPVPARVESLPIGGILDLTRLDRVEEVGKPRYCFPGSPASVVTANPT